MASKRGIFAIVVGIIGAIYEIWSSVQDVRTLIILTEKNSQGAAKSVTSINLVYSILMAIICLLLIFGVVKNKPNLVAGWVIWNLIGVVLLLVLLFFVSSAIEMYIYLFVVVICVAIWYPIYTLWRDMKNGLVITLD